MTSPQPAPSAGAVAKWRDYASLGVALLALTLSAAAMWQSSQPPLSAPLGAPPNTASPGRPEAAGASPAVLALQEANLALSRDLASLTERVAAIEPRPRNRDAGGAPPSASHPHPSLMPDGTPAYVRFDPPRGIRVEQVESGALAVENSDPSLTGKVLRVPAYAADGTSREVTILVPPPGR